MIEDVLKLHIYFHKDNKKSSPIKYKNEYQCVLNVFAV